MKFLELNKKRHATKHFTDKPVDPKDVRTAIEIATLAPSAHNSQPWKFVVVREKNAELAKLAYGSNFEQVSSAPVTIALFTDTDLAKRARKIARVGGANNFSEEQLQYFMKNLPAEFARYNEQQVSDYLALNAGLVAMNLVLALTDQGIGSNIILGFDKSKVNEVLLGFDKSKVNEVLEIEDRFRPELLITVGYTDDKLEPSYRLPVDEIIEKR
ncbi:nitroreductase [Streptococcus pneumoniae]|nr:nitroreductase [Streptococcus pneumoniae]